MRTKEEIIAKLTAEGIEFDPTAKKAELAALLPVEEQEADDLEEDTPALSERELAWQAFLAKAEQDAAKHGTSEIFAAQKARGEFDTVPDCFKY